MLKGETFDVEVEPSVLVKELKAAVEAAKPELGPAATMKLIFSGKILEDDKQFETYSFKESDFLVVMATKPKPVAAAGAAPASAAAATPAANPPQPAPAPAAAPPNEAPAAVVAGSAGGGQNNEAVDALCAMGFERAAVENCLRAAFGNPDRAVEYLTMGIPDGIMADQAPAAPPPAMGAPTAPPGAALGGAAQPFPAVPAGGGGGMAGTPFPTMGGAGGGTAGDANMNTGALQNDPQWQELQNNPQFQEVLAMIQQNPQMLQQMLPLLAQQNPELMQLINQNREEFAELLMAGGAGGMDGGREGAGFQLSPQEMEAVERLQQLGFPRAAVVQAYLACDKNEEIAANYLFEHGEDLIMQD